jgi:SHS2 domain-containing protein
MARHATIPHTADAGITATASDLPGLLCEAAAALGEVGAAVTLHVPASIWVDVAIEADDLPSLACAWLNELIALGDIEHATLVTVRNVLLDCPDTPNAVGPWRLRAQVGLRRYTEPGVRALRQVKSATFHGLVVEQQRDGWMLRAYLDL